MSASRSGFALLLALTASFALSPAAVAEFRVETELQPPSGITDARPFQFVVRVEGETQPRVELPAFPTVAGLQLLSGPNTNQRFVWSNGRASATFQIVYHLLAESAGSFEIPAIELRVDGQPLSTAPRTVEVRRAQDGSRGVTPGGTTAAPQETPDDTFLELRLGKSEVWVGEPVPLTVTLLTTQRVGQTGWQEMPSFSNFWVETLEIDPEGELTRRQIAGRTYLAYPIDRRMLIPPSPGEFTIEPYVARMQIVAPRRDAFDLFSFGRSQTIVRKTPEMKIRVRQLPAGEPAGFSGAVGEFRLRASFDRESAAVNDAVALSATVEGDGSLQSVDSPSFAAPPGLKVFDPQVRESSARGADGKLRSRKTWEWIVVPLDTGELQLPEVRFPYFSPEAGAYRVAATEGLRIAVERGEANGEPGGDGRADLSVGRDIAYIKPLHGDLRVSMPPAHRTTEFRLLVTLPVLLLPLAIWFGRRRARLGRDEGLSRSRRARGRARRRFRQARRSLEHVEAAEFHEELARTLVGYVADRFNRSAAGMTYESADDLLASRGVDTELRRRFRTCLETCDFARFVPATAKSERRGEVLDEAQRLVEEMERVL